MTCSPVDSPLVSRHDPSPAPSARLLPAAVLTALAWMAAFTGPPGIAAQNIQVESQPDDPSGSGRVVRVFRYSQQDGLPTRNMWEIMKGPREFVWIASDKGLIRFDGDHFMLFNKTNTNTFFENAEFRKLRYYDGDLFLISEAEGVLRFDLDTYSAEWVVSGSVVDYLMLPQSAPHPGAEFIVYQNGTASLRFGGERIWQETHPSMLGARSVYQSGAVYFSVPRYEIRRLDLTTFETTWIPLSENDRSSGFREDLYAVADTLIMFTSAGRIHLSENDKPFFIYPTPMIGEKTDIDFDEALHRSVEIGWQAVVADNEFFFRDAIDEPWNPVPFVNVQNQQIRSFTSSGLGLFFITTNQGLTVVQTFPSGIRHVNDKAVSVPNGIRIRRQIVRGSDGAVYLFGNPGLMRLEAPHIDQGPLDVDVLVNDQQRVFYAAVPVEDGFIATSEFSRVERLDLNGRRIRSSAFHDSLYGPKRSYFHYHTMVHVISPDSVVLGGDGQMLLTDVDFDQARVVELDKWLPPFPESQPDRVNYVNSMIKDTVRGGYWIVTDLAVLRIDERLTEVSEVYPAAWRGVNGDADANGLVNRTLNPLHLSGGADTLWIGGDLGVDVLDLGTGELIRHLRYPLSDDPVRVVGLVEDVEKRIWATTYEGIMVIDPASMDVWAMNTSHGLVNVEFNYKAIHRLDEDLFLFGGLNGYDVLRPGAIRHPNAVTPARISGLVRTDADSSIVFPLPQNSPVREFELVQGEEILELLVSEADMAGSLQNLTEYRFGDDAWVPLIGEKRIRLINPSDGEHRLQLRTRNAYGLSSDRTRDYLVRATTPFIRTNTFVFGSMMTIFLLTLILLLYGYLYSKRELDLRRKIAMDLHDEIGSVLTRTILFTERMRAKAPPAPSDPSAAPIERVLKNLKLSVFSLRLFIKSLTYGRNERSLQDAGLKEMIFTAFDGSPFTASCAVQKSFAMDLSASHVIRDIEMSLYELTANTLKHSDGDRVWVDVRSSEVGITLTFSDNGSIRSVEGIGAGSGYGLRNLQRRMSKYHSNVDISIREEGHGLRFVFVFPTILESRKRVIRRFFGLVPARA